MTELTGKRLEIALEIAEETGMTVEEADSMAERMVRGLERFMGTTETEEQK